MRDAATLTARPEPLLRLVDARAITDVAPYGLGPLLATRAGRTAAAAWIDELHAHGARVIIPIAGRDRLRALDALRAEHPATYVDALVTELEFWNRRDDRSRAFEDAMQLIAEMRAWARGTSRKVDVGAYLGYPTRAEAARLAGAIDFAYLNYSVASPARAWTSQRARYALFAGTRVALWPIFYATGEVDMRDALDAGGVGGAEAAFTADQRRDAAAAPAGFVYFTLEAMPGFH
ncbi:MAG: hypothetical protein KIT31_05415 [Deltaproteobacteria bacterium]|nr:hypothetical protein [Deltaproteobacteria bacterium]